MPETAVMVWRAARGLAVGAALLAAGEAASPAPVGQFQPVSEDSDLARSLPVTRTAGAADAESAVKLSAEQQNQVGLETAVLEAAPHPEQFRAYGAVLDIARITELTNSYANGQAQLLTAQAKLDVSRRAFERAQSLLGSAALPKKEAEAAEGTFRTDQAALAAAESQVRTLAATALQEWGAVLGKAIVERSPPVVRLMERDQLLVQVTLSPGVSLKETPRSALAQAPTRDTNIDLQFISPATRTDSRIQGLSYFFAAPGDSGLLPGMNTTVYVPSGRTYQGVFVEDTAIVRWQGRSWVYLRISPETFKRHPISTDQPISDDDFVVPDIPSGSEIVVRGAQALLSEEAKGELRGDDND